MNANKFFFQFFGVGVYGLSLMYLREKWPECLLHAHAEKITLEGYTVNQANIAVSDGITQLTQSNYLPC